MREIRLNSLTVDAPEIAEVLDLSTGEILPAQEAAIGEDYDKALKLRCRFVKVSQLASTLLACPLCVVPVHMVSLEVERRFYFRHEIEDGLCPAKTKWQLSEDRIMCHEARWGS